MVMPVPLRAGGQVGRQEQLGVQGMCKVGEKLGATLEGMGQLKEVGNP
jgi:hypothetical protein